MPQQTRIYKDTWYHEKVKYLQSLGWNQKTIAKHLRISVPTLSKIVKALNQNS